MGIEIERKFLVNKKLLPENSKSQMIEQAYLTDDPERLLRIRIAGSCAFLNIKGKGTSIARTEFEYEIPVKDARKLMKMTIFPPIKKIRHIIFHEGKKWEVDFFSGKNEGLIVAEIELDHEDEKVLFPEWIGKEVTGDSRFFNHQLSKHPFNDW